MFFDPMYFLFLSPALLLAAWAQWKVKSTFASAQQVYANLSGAATARYILDQGGLHYVEIEEVDGFLSDHYDPSARVVRLSSDVFHGQDAAAVGIAAHECGHALQHGQSYAPLVIRNFAVPAAQWGPTASIILLIAGAAMNHPYLILFGLIAFGGVVFFQLVNLPVEIDASNRAKRLLNELQIIDGDGVAAVRSVLNAAAWTYVAATLQSVLTLLYYIIRFGGHLSSGRRHD